MIIAGGRDFNQDDLLFQKCDFYTKWFLADPIVVSGGARGADKLGEVWATWRGYNIHRFPADWEQYGRRAGPLRNRQMAEYATHAIIFWDGKSRGAEHMIKTAQEHNILTKVVRYE